MSKVDDAVKLSVQDSIICEAKATELPNESYRIRNEKNLPGINYQL
jgi:hypothetical protein